MDEFRESMKKDFFKKFPVTLKIIILKEISFLSQIIPLSPELLEKNWQGLPGGPVVKISCLHCMGHVFNP